MKLLQFYLPGVGKRVGVLEGEEILDITIPEAPTSLALLQRAAQAGERFEEHLRRVVSSSGQHVGYTYSDLDVPPDLSRPHLLLPLDAPEVWGFGVTYKRSAQSRDVDSQSDIYTRVYFSERPEIFFKASPHRCSPPNDFIGIRSDSQLTATEPELAFVIGANGAIVGYTACNDVSAWDIERENPLYLPQSKIYCGCCSFGPVIVTAEQCPDPYNLELRCRILRDGKVIFEESVNTSRINRRFEVMVEYLSRNNYVPIGTVVSTGTGIMVPHEYALRDADLVEIEVEGVGKLVNYARKL